MGVKMMKKVTEIACIICPLACHVSVAVDDESRIIEVTNFQCKKGKEYAVAESRSSRRVLTTTVIVEKSRHALLPVRTNAAIPREKLFDCMDHLARVRVEPPLKSGEVIVGNILDTGSDIITTRELID
jgi:CxxC motif-containing protein